MPERHPAPPSWSEIERPPDIVEKYNPKEPTLFEHEDEPVAVHVVPETTNIHDHRERWRVGLVHGSKTEFEGADPIRTNVGTRAGALEVAEEFMADYQERVVEGEETVTDVMLDCCEPAVRRVE